LFGGKKKKKSAGHAARWPEDDDHISPVRRHCGASFELVGRYQPGDLAIICHKSHSHMNAMGNRVWEERISSGVQKEKKRNADLVGPAHRAGRFSRIIGNGLRRQAEMGEHGGCRLREENTAHDERLTAHVKFGDRSKNGGAACFQVVKVREGLGSQKRTYTDPPPPRGLGTRQTGRHCRIYEVRGTRHIIQGKPRKAGRAPMAPQRPPTKSFKPPPSPVPPVKRVWFHDSN